MSFEMLAERAKQVEFKPGHGHMMHVLDCEGSPIALWQAM